MAHASGDPVIDPDDPADALAAVLRAADNVGFLLSAPSKTFSVSRRGERNTASTFMNLRVSNGFSATGWLLIW